MRWPDRPAGRAPIATPPLTLLLVAVVYGSMLFWIWLHPFPTGWDEAHYVNSAWEDRAAFDRGGVKGLVSSFVFHGRSAPPAYRLVALPVSILLSPSPRALRFWWSVLFALTLFFVYRLAALLGGAEAGWLAVSLAALTPGILSWAMRFQTEGPLFLALAATLYLLLEGFRARQPSRWKALALGFTTGVGLVSKLTFALLVAPVTLALLLADRTNGEARLRWLTVSGIAALLIAGPFYALNLPRYLAYGRSSQSWARTEIPGVWTKLTTWLETFAGFNLGPLLVVLLVALGATLTRKKRRGELDRSTGVALAALASGAVPLLFLHLVGTNAFQRLTAPVLLALLPAVGALASRMGFTRGRAGIVLTLLAVAQAGALLLPLAVPSSRYEKTRPAFRGVLTAFRPAQQWDWEPLRRLVLDRWPPPHEIFYVGLGEAYNAPQIRYPWVRRSEPVDVRPLWSFLEGDPDPALVSERLATATAVVTAPSLDHWAPVFYPEIVRRRFDDNRHNRQLQSWLNEDPRFAPPVQLPPGGPDAPLLLVYLRHPTATGPTASR